MPITHCRECGKEREISLEDSIMTRGPGMYFCCDEHYVANHKKLDERWESIDEEGCGGNEFWWWP
jgi:hypothetical protein